MEKKEFIILFLVFNLRIKELVTYNYFRILQEKRKNNETPIYQPFILRQNSIYCEEVDLYYEKLKFMDFIEDNSEMTEKGKAFYYKKIEENEEEYEKLKKIKITTKYREIKNKSCYVPSYDFINCGVCQEKICQENFFTNIKKIFNKKNKEKNPYKSF